MKILDNEIINLFKGSFDKLIIFNKNNINIEMTRTDKFILL